MGPVGTLERGRGTRLSRVKGPTLHRVLTATQGYFAAVATDCE